VDKRVIGFNVSVSNDDVLYSEEIKVVRMDSTCMSCKWNGNGCSIKVKIFSCR